MLDNIILDYFAHEKKVGSLKYLFMGNKTQVQTIEIRVSGDLIAHLEL